MINILLPDRLPIHFFIVNKSVRACVGCSTLPLPADIIGTVAPCLSKSVCHALMVLNTIMSQ